jgi:hypothetical protein
VLGMTNNVMLRRQQQSFAHSAAEDGDGVAGGFENYEDQFLSTAAELEADPAETIAPVNLIS